MLWLRRGLLYLQAIFYVFAGVNHFRNPGFYLRMMPPYLPWPSALHLTAGAAEIGLGLALLLPQTRVWAAWGLMALLIAIFPANLHMALHPELFPAMPPAGLWIRLPFQLVFLAWAYWYTRPERSASAA
jgi:uncharacterized membrane protein